MTTILADFRLGVIVSDSSISDDDRVWSGKKVFRHKGTLYGFSGLTDEAVEFMAWIRRGKVGKLPRFAQSDCLVLSQHGLVHFNNGMIPQPVAGGIEAIGTGAKAVMCAYEAMIFTDPVRAVKIVCKHDSGSRGPARVYRLKP